MNISKYILRVLMIASAVLLVCFYLFTGDDTIDVAGDALSVPTLTDPMLYWAYALVAGVAVCTIWSVIKQYILKFKTDKTSAIKSLATVGALVLILLVTFALGSGEKMDIIGYEGTDNEGFWAQFTDMCLYTMYVLIALAVLAIVGSSIYNKFLRK